MYNIIYLPNIHKQRTNFKKCWLEFSFSNIKTFSYTWLQWTLFCCFLLKLFNNSHFSFIQKNKKPFFFIQHFCEIYEIERVKNNKHSLQHWRQTTRSLSTLKFYLYSYVAFFQLNWYFWTSCISKEHRSLKSAKMVIRKLVEKKQIFFQTNKDEF